MYFRELPPKRTICVSINCLFQSWPEWGLNGDRTAPLIGPKKSAIAKKWAGNRSYFRLQFRHLPHEPHILTFASQLLKHYSLLGVPPISMPPSTSSVLTGLSIPPRHQSFANGPYHLPHQKPTWGPCLAILVCPPTLPWVHKHVTGCGDGIIKNSGIGTRVVLLPANGMCSTSNVGGEVGGQAHRQVQSISG